MHGGVATEGRESEGSKEAGLRVLRGRGIRGLPCADWLALK